MVSEDHSARLILWMRWDCYLKIRPIAWKSFSLPLRLKNSTISSLTSLDRGKSTYISGTRRFSSLVIRLECMRR